MKLTIAAKKIGNAWEGALVAEGRFQRALVGEKIEDVILRGLVGLLAIPQPEGLNLVVDIITESEEEVQAAKARQEAVSGPAKAKA